MDKIIIFGEKINTVNQAVATALEKKDKEFFKYLTQAQIDSGIIDVIDINVGSDPLFEPDNMKWVIDIVEEITGGKFSLSIDSSSPKSIIAGIEKLKNKKGSYLNSITLEEPRYKNLLPVARQYDLNIIGLPIEGRGIPETSEGRLKLAYKLVELISDYEINLSRLFIDCIIEPVSISHKNALISLDTISKIKKNIPQVKTFICLSAVSFGLPNRKLINRNFLTLLIKEGIDAIILDPLDSDLVLNLYASNLLTGKDEYCLKYLKYIKKSSDKKD